MSRQARPVRVLHRRHFVVAKKGLRVEKSSEAKFEDHGCGRPRWSPVAVHIASASPRAVTLVPDTVDSWFIAPAPERMIGENAWDSDKLDAELEQNDIEIAPHRGNRTRPPTQDGRAQRRYKRRWKVERLFAGSSTSVESFPAMLITPLLSLVRPDRVPRDSHAAAFWKSVLLAKSEAAAISGGHGLMHDPFQACHYGRQNTCRRFPA